MELSDARPYPNEHAARLKDPDQYDSFRRVNDEFASGIDAIYGIKDGTTEFTEIGPGNFLRRLVRNINKNVIINGIS